MSYQEFKKAMKLFEALKGKESASKMSDEALMAFVLKAIKK